MRIFPTNDPVGHLRPDLLILPGQDVLSDPTQRCLQVRNYFLASHDKDDLPAV